MQFTRLTSLDFEISLTISYLFEFQTHPIKCYFKENTNVCILFCNSKLTELDVKMQLLALNLLQKNKLALKVR